MSVEVTVEVLQGQRNEYEIDHETGRMVLDRTLFPATRYPADYDADAVFEVGGAIGRRARGAVVAARDAATRFDEDELAVCVGRPRGAHGHQGPDPVERILLAQDGPSLLVLPPPAADSPPSQ